MIKVSGNVKEDEPQSETGVDVTNTKNKTLVECVTKYSRGLICLTKQLAILLRTASKVFSGCLSFTPIQLLLIETQFPQLSITLKHQALSCFGRAQRPWLKISDQPIKEEILLVIILVIRRRNLSILARTINYMSLNPLWTPIKFTVSSSTPNCRGPGSSPLNTPRIN